ncbi:MAG: OmpA family protein [Balneolales bacterium]|nr:OmpA family protein [Balneolales bacterium]
MITTLNSKIKTSLRRSTNNLVAYFVIGFVLLAGAISPVHAQETEYERPSWKFGLTAAGNANFYQGTTQQLTDSFISPQAFGHGKGLGLFGGLTIEYHRPETLFGFMLQTGFDSRRGKYDQVTSPCNCPLDLSTNLSYLTIEPSLRYAPFRSDFHIFGGPRFAFLLNKSFEFEQGVNPDFPNELDVRNINDDFSSMEQLQISMQIGAGWDIPISSTSNRTQYIISPYIAYHPYMGQTPRSIETWNITTIRAGVSFKFGQGKRIAPVMAETPPLVPPAVSFTVNSPVNNPVAVSFIESFPLRNYVFFDSESTSIPDRYIRLNREQAANFNEVQLGGFNQVTVTGRSARQMTVYYNILNILGDRMVKNPSATITLVGSSDKGVPDATQKAEAVKTYLVNIFGINASRITTSGRLRPAVASLQAGGSRELDLLRQEESRVSIESSSPILLREFQTRPDAPLSSTTSPQEAPLDSYVTFNVGGEIEGIESWMLEVTDENNRVQNFGPYYTENISLSGKSILGDRPRGMYKIVMIGEGSNGTTVRKETRTEIVQWVESVVEKGNRYSVIFEFDQSTVSAAYEKYLIDVVLPVIAAGSTVRIQGYSDTIGDPDHNMRLSEARAESVRTIIQNALAATNRTNVRFDVKGHGEIIAQSQFNNTLPEERFYNRTVVIDVMTPR